MKLVYDPRHNIAYLRLHEKTAPVETLHLSDEINVDIADPEERGSAPARHQLQKREATRTRIRRR